MNNFGKPPAGDKNLVNFKTYYFSVIAYAHNNYKPYDPTDPNSQKLPYLEGRKNIKVYTAIPHNPTPENNGSVLNAEYGDGPELTRLAGQGNGGLILDLTEDSEKEALANGVDEEATYMGRRGPVDVMVYDPLKVPEADFELFIFDTSTVLEGERLNPESSFWRLVNVTTGETVVDTSDQPLSVVNEQILPEIGLSITTRQPDYPGGEHIDLSLIHI